jgi:transketolase N-terminal domain/subunit
MAGPRRPVAQKLSITSTSTGTVGTAYFAEGMSAFSVSHKLTGGSTKAVSITAQGSLGDAGIWKAMMAATTCSTGGAIANSTGSMVFDAVRVQITTTNDTTGNGTLTCWVAAR